MNRTQSRKRLTKKELSLLWLNVISSNSYHCEIFRFLFLTCYFAIMLFNGVVKQITQMDCWLFHLMVQQF